MYELHKKEMKNLQGFDLKSDEDGKINSSSLCTLYFVRI